jgi:hypothetical protein
MSTAREGTESEPRRWTLWVHDRTGALAADMPMTGEGWDPIVVQEVVGSGHDEQTEARLREAEAENARLREALDRAYENTRIIRSDQASREDEAAREGDIR